MQVRFLPRGHCAIERTLSLTSKGRVTVQNQLRGSIANTENLTRGVALGTISYFMLRLCQ